ncbi:dihydropteroate synthase [Acetobacteraceae bacterium]|nr:dihydropteroate synthase [Acetobacteraceae bacterium]
MGILNITPDSFSDAGRFFSPSKALEQANRLLDEGADILDVGAESTRPNATPLSAKTEIQRLKPILTLLKDAKIPFSLDSYKAQTAAFALPYGAEMINDIGGLQKDPNMATIIAQSAQKTGKHPLVVVMQSLSEKNPNLPLKEQFQIFFEKSLKIAEKAGIPTDKLILDPGIGFGKTPEQNIECLSLIPFLKETYQLPILIGLSKKGFLGQFNPLPHEASERLPTTLGADFFAALKGADILRVHDISAHKSFFQILKTLFSLEESHP